MNIIFIKLLLNQAFPSVFLEYHVRNTEETYILQFPGIKFLITENIYFNASNKGHRIKEELEINLK